MTLDTKGKPYSIKLTIEIRDRDGTSLDSAMLEHSSASLRRWRPEEGDLDVCLSQAREAIEREIGEQRQEAEQNVTQLLMEKIGNPRGGSSFGAGPPAVLDPAEVVHASYYQDEVNEAVRGYSEGLVASKPTPPEDCSSSYTIGWGCAQRNSVKPLETPEEGSPRYEIYRGLLGFEAALQGFVASLLYESVRPEPHSFEQQGKDSFKRCFSKTVADLQSGRAHNILQAWAVKNLEKFKPGLIKVKAPRRRKVFGYDPLDPPKALSDGDGPLVEGTPGFNPFGGP